MYLGVFPDREYAVGAVSGVFASVVAVLIMHPIESVKVRMQNVQHTGAGSASGWERAKALMRHPYYGVGPHQMQYAVMNFIRFGSYNSAKAFMLRHHKTPALESEAAPVNKLPLHSIFACGAFSGTCIAACLHPLFVVKTHQQVNRLGVQEAVLNLWSGEGVQGLYRTFLAGFIRFPVALGFLFTVYEALKRPEFWPNSLRHLKQQPCQKVDDGGSSYSAVITTVASRAAAGGVAGVVCWSSIYPLDVVQSRVVGEARYGIAARRYPSVLSGFSTVYHEEGLRAFTRGYSAVLLRSGPVNAVLLPVNDAMTPFADWLLPRA